MPWTVSSCRVSSYYLPMCYGIIFRICIDGCWAEQLLGDCSKSFDSCDSGLGISFIWV